MCGGHFLCKLSIRLIKGNIFDQIGQFVTAFNIPELLLDASSYFDENGQVTLRFEMLISSGTMTSLNSTDTYFGIYLLSSIITIISEQASCQEITVRARKTHRSILIEVGY